MKSTAAVAHSLRSPFVVEEVDLPDLQHTDRLVRLVAVGICHTDIGSRDGQLPAPFPASFGHEGAGDVERVGDQVRKVTPGDHVVLAPESGGDSWLGGIRLRNDHRRRSNRQPARTGKRAKAVRGFVEGNSIPVIFIPRLIDLYAQGRFPFDKFVRFYPFDEINRAVEDQRNGIAIKPILEVAAA